MEEVSHREIYDRLVRVESKVDRVEENTKDIVSAFNAARGAFTVLEWIAKAAKPLIVIGTLIGGVWAILTQIKFK
jgi:hypothetical protein